MLKVRTKNGLRVKHIKDRPISSNLLQIIENIESNKIDYSLYELLDNDEKELIDTLLSDSKIKHNRYNQSDINELVRQYNIIKGELLIGNDNPELLKQLKIIIIRLVNLGILTMREITPLLHELFLLL
mgnify:CR=1 FL=1